MDVPELGRDRFVEACVQTFSPLTLYAYVVRQMEQNGHDEAMKRRLTHEVATWISKFPTSQMLTRHKHILRLLTLFVKFADQVHAQLDTIRVAETLFGWAATQKAGFMPSWFKPTLAATFPPVFRLFSRMIGIAMLSAIDGKEQFANLIQQQLQLVQREAWPLHRDCLDELHAILEKDGALRDVVSFVDFLTPRLMK